MHIFTGYNKIILETFLIVTSWLAPVFSECVYLYIYGYKLQINRIISRHKYRQVYLRSTFQVICFTTVLWVPDCRPSIQCQPTKLLTGRAWASIQTDVFCITLYESLTMNCWNTLSMSSSVMIGSVEFLPAQNFFASFQLNTEPLV